MDCASDDYDVYGPKFEKLIQIKKTGKYFDNYLHKYVEAKKEDLILSK